MSATVSYLREPPFKFADRSRGLLQLYPTLPICPLRRPKFTLSRVKCPETRKYARRASITRASFDKEEEQSVRRIFRRKYFAVYLVATRPDGNVCFRKFRSRGRRKLAANKRKNNTALHRDGHVIIRVRLVSCFKPFASFAYAIFFASY